MHLWIIRHAEATPAVHAADDFRRRLSRRGHADAERVARWLKRSGYAVDAIVTSDAPRAKETATLIAPGFGLEARHVRTNHVLYNASAATILDVIREAPDAWRSFALVGHNPGVSVTVQLLTDDRAARPLPTLGVVRLDIDRVWSDVEAGTATLSLYLEPATVD